MSGLTFLIICLEGAVLSFNVAASAALVPSIARDFALSQFVAGKIVWLYMIPYGLAALAYGPLVRAFDAKRIELICITIFSLANLLAAFSRNITELFAARILMGLFGASVIPLGLILISRYLAQDKRGRFVGMFFSATFVASLLGLFLSGIINWRLIYLIPAICGLALSVVVYFYLPSFKQNRELFTINYRASLRDKRVFSVFTYIFVISLIYHGVQQWLAVYFAKDFKLSQFAISMLVTLTSLSGIFGEAIGGHFADTAGRVKTANIGIALMILSVFLLLLKLPVAFLACLMIIWGLGWTFNHASLSTILTDVPKKFLNESASLNSSVRFISGGLGAAFGGVLMQIGSQVNFIFFGIGLILLTLCSKNLLIIKTEER